MPTITSGFSTQCTLLWVKHAAIFFALVFCNNSPLWADARALPDGQANVAGQFGGFDLDLSALGNTDEQRAGARILWPYFSDYFVLFLSTQSSDSTRAGVALGNDVDVSGRTTGGGIYITGLPEWRDYTVNLRLSGESEELDVDSNIAVGGVQAQTSFKDRSVSFALILSPAAPMFSNGANTYLTLGAAYHRSTRRIVLDGQNESSLRRYEQEYVPQLAVGVVYPFKRISFFASLEYDQELALGLGLRLNVMKRRPG